MSLIQSQGTGMQSGPDPIVYISQWLTFSSLTTSRPPALEALLWNNSLSVVTSSTLLKEFFKLL